MHHRILNPFEQEIMQLVDSDFYRADINTLKSIAINLTNRAHEEAKKTGETEKTHPVYFAMLYIVAAQFCVYEDKTIWASSSQQYVERSLLYMQKNSSKLLEDPEWMRRRNTILELFNNHFLVVMNKLTNQLRTQDIAQVSATVCADNREATCSYLRQLGKEPLVKTAAFLIMLRRVLEEIASCHNLLRNFKNYYEGDRFRETKICTSFLEISYYFIAYYVHHAGEVIPHIKGIIVEKIPDLIIKFGKVGVFALQSLGKYKREPKAMSLVNVLYLTVLANRVSMMAIGADTYYREIYSKALDENVVRPLLKNNTDVEANMLVQLFYFDRWRVKRSQHDWGELFEQTQGVIDKALKENVLPEYHVAMHITTLWSGLNHITMLLVKRYAHFFGHKAARMQDAYQCIDKLMDMDMKDDPRFHEMFPSMARRGLVDSVNKILTQIEASFDAIREIPRGCVIVDGLIPLPGADEHLPHRFKLLPTIELLWQSQNQWSSHELQLASDALRDDVAAMRACYSRICVILLLFAYHPEWFAHGQSTTLLFADFIENILLKRIDAINTKYRALQNSLVTYDDDYQASVNFSKYMTHRFVEEEASKNRLRREARQLKLAAKKTISSRQQLIILQNNKSSEDDFNQDHDDVLPPSEPTLQDKADDIFANAMDALSKGRYYKAQAYYSELGELHQDFALKSQEGLFVCQVEIVIRRIMQLRRKLQAMAASVDRVSPEQTQTCEIEIQYLQEECQSLEEQYHRFLQAMVDIDSINLHFLKERRQNLEKAWNDIKSVKDAVAERLQYSRYEYIMSLGFKIKQTADSEHNALLAVGVSEHVHGGNPNKQNPLYTKYQAIYQAGWKKFKLQGEANRERSQKESPYVSMRELLANLDVMISSARATLKLTNVQVPCSTSSSVSTVSSTSSTSSSTSSTSSTISASSTLSLSLPTIEQMPSLSKNMPASELLEYLRDSDFMDDSETSLLSTWTKNNPVTLFLLVQQKEASSDLAYECFSNWCLTPNVKERILFLDKTGILRFILSLSGSGPLIPAKKLSNLQKRLDAIGASLKMNKQEWKVDLIFAQILTTIYLSAFDREWLLDHLMHYGFTTNPLRQMCEALKLSKTCQSALHGYLATHVQMNQAVVSHPNKTIQALDAAVQKYNRMLLSTVNTQKAPAHLLIYGSSGYLHLIYTDHVPADYDVRTNLPVSEWPFKAELHQHLAEYHIYKCFLDNQQQELGVSIKCDNGPILDAIQSSDFTISHAMFHLGLRHMVYWSQEAFDDLLHKKVLCFVKPVTALYHDPQLILRVLIAGNNTKFYLCDRDAFNLNALVIIQCNEARSDKKKFLKPVIDPGCLLHFLITYCVYRSSEQYLTLAHHYKLLPLLLPLPFDACELNHVAYERFKAVLQQFDHERMASKSQQLDCWMLLGKLITDVFVVFMTQLKDGHSLMNQALRELAHFLPLKPNLMSAVQQYLAFYGYKDSGDIGLASSMQAVFNTFNPLQAPIEAKPEEMVSETSKQNLS